MVAKTEPANASDFLATGFFTKDDRSNKIKQVNGTFCIVDMCSYFNMLLRHISFITYLLTHW